MLTKLEPRFPIPTGDAARDYFELKKTFEDWYRRLNEKGALSIQPVDITHLPIFAVDDYVKQGATDASIGLRDLATALVAAGSGIIDFGKDKTYTIWSSDTTRVLDLRGANNVVIRGNGATIESARASGPGSSAYFIDVTAVVGVDVSNINFSGGNTSLDSAAGDHFLIGANGTANVSVRNCTIIDCQVGISYSANTNRNYGLVVENCTFNRVYYPLNLYQTDDIYARYVSINGGRAAFLAAPINNFDISVDSQNGGPYSDIEMIVYADVAKSVAYNTISNGRINYRTDGRYSGSGDQGSQEGLVHFIIKQLDADSSSGHFRDIHVHICADANGTDQPSNAVMFSRYKSDSTGDNVSRTHTLRNLSFSGSLINWNNATGNGIVLFSTATITTAMTWTSDLIENIAIRDLSMIGAPATDSIYVNGQGAVSGKQFLTLDNVKVDGTYTEANVSGAKIARRNLTASNVTAVENGAVSYTPSWTGAGGNPAIGNGTITGIYSQQGQMVDVTVKITPGSTTTFGSGVYSISLPVTAASDSSSALGAAYALQSGTAMHSGVCRVDSGASTMKVALGAASGTEWAHNVPWTFANGDYVICTLRYRVT